MFQLFSREKEYTFRDESLTFEKEKASHAKRLLRIASRILMVNLLALLFIVGYCSIFEPPANIYRAKQVNQYLEQLNSANGKLAEIQKSFSGNTVYSDKIYREVLMLDSLPGSVRKAGIGGSAEQTEFNSAKIIAKDLLLKTNQLFAQLRVQSNSYDTIYKEAIQFHRKLDRLPGIPPVIPNYKTYISSYFGSRTDPFTHRHRRHKGLDFVGPENCEIFATGDGTVTLAKHSRRGYGNEIVIDHGYGYITRYGHLNKILITQGQNVKRGQLIGLMGSTGRSTGTHLHYEVRLHNVAINPLYFYDDDLSSEEYELITRH